MPCCYHCVCCRIYCEDKHSFLQDCEDDGETAAGGRLLHLLQVIIRFGHTHTLIVTFLEKEKHDKRTGPTLQNSLAHLLLYIHNWWCAPSGLGHFQSA